MFVALKNFGSKDKQFYTGQEVPAEFVTPRVVELGCVGQVKDTLVKKTETKTEILTEDSSDVKVEVQEKVQEKTETKVDLKKKFKK